MKTQTTASPTASPAVSPTAPASQAADPAGLYVTRRAQVADELGLECVALPDARFAVKGEPHKSIPPETYTVTFHLTENGTVAFGCTCKAGQYRTESVPCKHAAAAGRFMEHSGLASFAHPERPVGWSLTAFARSLARKITPDPSLPVTDA